VPLFIHRRRAEIMTPSFEDFGNMPSELPLASSYGAADAHQPLRKNRLMMMCPSGRDLRELNRIVKDGQLSIINHEYASLELESLVADDPAQPEIRDPDAEIATLIERCASEKVTAVASTDDYPGSTLAAIAAHHLGLPGVPPQANLNCQHKFLSRRIQQEAAPEAVPHFTLIDVRPELGLPSGLVFPLFVKPVKSYLSQGAQVVSSSRELRQIQSRWLRRSRFFEIFDVLLRRYAKCSLGYSFLIAEDCLTGHQVTLDGYAFNSDVFVMGIVDSIMFPGTLAFKRFEYPSSLPAAVQDRMAAIAIAVIKASGYGNGQFNIEFIYDAEQDRLAIIEINPRMSSQFADLYEKVDGTNSYRIMIDLALGRQPRPQKRKGRHAYAASCVLRTFQNQRVLRVPGVEELDRIYDEYPDIRVEILAAAGMKLSQQLQDGRSYRYGLLNIGGRDRQDIAGIFRDCVERLNFVFEPV
jgi:biotin carboxylase